MPRHLRLNLLPQSTAGEGPVLACRGSVWRCASVCLSAGPLGGGVACGEVLEGEAPRGEGAGRSRWVGLRPLERRGDGAPWELVEDASRCALAGAGRPWGFRHRYSVARDTPSAWAAALKPLSRARRQRSAPNDGANLHGVLLQAVLPTALEIPSLTSRAASHICLNQVKTGVEPSSQPAQILNDASVVRQFRHEGDISP